MHVIRGKICHFYFYPKKISKHDVVASSVSSANTYLAAFPMHVPTVLSVVLLLRSRTPAGVRGEKSPRLHSSRTSCELSKQIAAECLRLFFQTGSNSFLLSERMPPVSSAKPLQRNAECVMHEDCRLLSASAISKRRHDGTFESL